MLARKRAFWQEFMRISEPIDVIGISVRAKRKAQIAYVHKQAVATADLIGVNAELPIEMVEAYDE